MNRNNLKPFLLAGALAVSAAASAQNSPFPVDPYPPTGVYISGWILGPCLKTPPPPPDPYSTVYLEQFNWDDLFGAWFGVTGTGSFDNLCFNPSVSLSNQGRLGFYIGPIGSCQDFVYPVNAPNPPGPQNNYTDSWLFLNMGGWDATCGNWSYADTVEVKGTTTTRTPFGKSAIDTTWYGASDRYYVAESTNGDLRVQMKTDILGDAARVTWNIINTSTTTVQIGLEFGQWVRFFQASQAWNGTSDGIVTVSGAPFPQSPEVTPWITVPGYKPLLVDSRFMTNPALSTSFPANQMASPINFGIDQKRAYGLSLPTMPDPTIPDQTPIDCVDIGKSGFLLGLVTAQDEPMPPFQPAANSLTGAPLLPDTTFTSEAAYVERWFPQSASPGESRMIVSYYRSTWSSSNYAAPYSVVLDAPNLVPLNSGDVNLLNPNPMIIRVYVDNASSYPNGFGTVNQNVPLEDVEVQLKLPQGIVDASDGHSTTLTQYIPLVPPVTTTLSSTGTPLAQSMIYADFEVVADPGSLPPGTIPQQVNWTNVPPPATVFGQLSYSVTVTPNPGPAKTLTGVINVGTRPELNISNNANLIGVPWVFGDSSWATIFSANTNPDTGVTQPGLVLNQDYQAYAWDPIQQTYVGSAGAQRGLGYWLLISPSALAKAQADVLSDRNLEAASPTEPADLGTGGLEVDLQPGWNLISNPYDYGIPIGDLVGVSAANPTAAETYAQLAGQGLVSPTMAYWNNDDQSYQFTTTFADLLQPNTGYWVFVSSPQKVTIVFPAVSAPFLPVPPPSIPNVKHSYQPHMPMPTASWKLNLVVAGAKSTDRHNFIGVVADSTKVALAAIRKPPVAPLPNAVSASVVQSVNGKTTLLAQSLLANAQSLSWNWQVYSRPGGTTRIVWPNISSVPSSMDVTLVDSVNGTKTDMRATSSYTYNAAANETHNFVIQVGAYTGPILTSLTAKTSGTNVNITYKLDVAATTTIKVFKGTQLIQTVESGVSDSAGSHNVTWNEKNSQGSTVGSGVYTIQVTSAIPNRSSVMSTSVSVTR